MFMYQVITNFYGDNPFVGDSSYYVHKTLEGAWKEIGDTLEGYFQEYLMNSITILRIDVDTDIRCVRIVYVTNGITRYKVGHSMHIGPVSIVE